MKITTWNINGLRAGLNKGMLENIAAIAPDVLCLQEIKARPEQLDSASLQNLQAAFPDIHWNPAQRPGYSGTATLSLLSPVKTTFGLGVEEFDSEGRLIAQQFPNFWLFNIYFPNGQHDLGRVPFKLNFYARLLDLCDQLHAAGQEIILCGDFNTAHNEIDLRHPRANSTATGFLPEERAWVDRFLSHGFVDVFRTMYPDRVEYSWWSFIGNARKNNTGWRLDYFLVSEKLASQVHDVIHHSGVMGSDHCPVTLILKEE
jgi:exodeoxyribonuclease III